MGIAHALSDIGVDAASCCGIAIGIPIGIVFTWAILGSRKSRR